MYLLTDSGMVTWMESENRAREGLYEGESALPSPPTSWDRRSRTAATSRSTSEDGETFMLKGGHGERDRADQLRRRGRCVHHPRCSPTAHSIRAQKHLFAIGQ